MNHSIKIIWNEAAFIDLDGKSGRVAHTGIKYIDRNASQPPSVIPASASVSDFAIPTDRIYYQQEYYNRYYSRSSGWEEVQLVLPAFRTVASTDITAEQAFRAEAEKNKGKRFGLLLPLQIAGVVNEYTFWFEVQSVIFAK